MPNNADIAWFKAQFGAQVRTAVQGTPFTLDMLTAIACQETGYIWGTTRKQGLATADILRLCTGDTIDAKPNGKGRGVFPKNKADLLTHPDGAAMFAVARKALVDMAQHVPGYNGAVANPDKFCHAFGIFQYDLQHFDKDKAYFPSGGYKSFEVCAAKCVGERLEARKAAKVQNRPTLDDADMAAVAIAYNTGRYNPAKGLKQGHFDGEHYYGEYFAQFLAAAHAVPDPAIASDGGPYTVHVDGNLNLRSSPERIPTNLRAVMPNGQPVRAITGIATNGFLEIKTILAGVTVRGFAWAGNLVRG